MSGFQKYEWIIEMGRAAIDTMSISEKNNQHQTDPIR